MRRHTQRQAVRAASRPVRTSASRPVRTSASRPVRTSASRPVRTAASRPVRTAASRPVRAVLLPGNGSDDIFITKAFAEPLASAGIALFAARPQPGPGIVDQLGRELNLAAGQYGGVLAGGVSLGAHLAASWAARDPVRCSGLLVALPAWTGAPGDAPAATAALASAAVIDAAGLDTALDQVRAGSPPWIADELDRAWRGYGHGLAASLRAGAAAPGPSLDELRGLEDVPVGIAALTDDPLHPLEVARAWLRALPRAALVTTSLAAIGRDPQALGRAALLAFLRAAAGQSC
jgi:pimeloyl-ACP methyl ester carboxylesterase